MDHQEVQKSPFDLVLVLGQTWEGWENFQSGQRRIHETHSSAPPHVLEAFEEFVLLVGGWGMTQRWGGGSLVYCCCILCSRQVVAAVGALDCKGADLDHLLECM